MSDLIKIIVAPILREKTEIKRCYARACAAISKVVDEDIKIPRENAHDWTIQMTDLLWNEIWRPEWDKLNRLLSVIRNFEREFSSEEEKHKEKFLSNVAKN